MGDLAEQRSKDKGSGTGLSPPSPNNIERFLNLVKTVIGLLSIPLGISLIILQEFVGWLRQRKGLGNKSLEGKVAFITGANSGIGESLAKYFYLAGCKVILAARRKNELERVRNALIKLPADGKKVYTPSILQLDLGELKSIPNKADAAIAMYGSVDILVNNAGIFSQGSVLDTIMEVDEQIMNVNYLGTLALTKAIGKHMRERKTGHIVFISSILGKFSAPFSSTYAASKHALQALTDSLRAEVKVHGINVTLISPGYVKTDMSANALTANGQKLGQMTKEFESGYTPDFVAERTLKAVVNEESDVIICPGRDKLVIYIRHLVPNLFFSMMSRHAGNLQKAK